MSLVTSKTAARIAAIQALYQYESNGRVQDLNELCDSIVSSYNDQSFKEIFDIEDYEYLYLRVSPDQDPSEIAGRIEEKFRKRRGQKEGEEDFTIQTFDDVMATFTNMILILNGVLVMIALISLVVAAVNITNTMYTSVLERTREIGVMKAIGSRNRQILDVFVIESGILI